MVDVKRRETLLRDDAQNLLLVVGAVGTVHGAHRPPPLGAFPRRHIQRFAVGAPVGAIGLLARAARALHDVHREQMLARYFVSLLHQFRVEIVRALWTRDHDERRVQHFAQRDHHAEEHVKMHEAGLVAEDDICANSPHRVRGANRA